VTLLRQCVSVSLVVQQLFASRISPSSGVTTLLMQCCMAQSSQDVDLPCRASYTRQITIGLFSLGDMPRGTPRAGCMVVERLRECVHGINAPCLGMAAMHVWRCALTCSSVMGFNSSSERFSAITPIDMRCDSSDTIDGALTSPPSSSLGDTAAAASSSGAGWALLPTSSHSL
jgi:hypothetical protein